MIVAQLPEVSAQQDREIEWLAEPMIANRPARYMDLIFIGITYFDRQR